jgi:hypothetical protein
MATDPHGEKSFAGFRYQKKSNPESRNLSIAINAVNDHNPSGRGQVMI